jgi:hypothetical protein
VNTAYGLAPFAALIVGYIKLHRFIMARSEDVPAQSH